MKKLLLSFVMMLMATAAAWAQYAVVDGVRYELSSDKAYVVAPESGVYTGAIAIPATISSGGNDYAVTDIKSGAFENSTITSLSLPVGLKYIFSSFAGTSLTSLTIPGTVTYLTPMGSCTSLTSITFTYDGIDGITDEYYWPSGYPKGIELSWDCFTGCTNLTEINVDRPLYNRGANNTALFGKATKATFGPHATNIPMACFYGVTTLQQLTIGANVTEIETNAFKQGALPSGSAFPFSQMKKIETEAFYECKNLPAAIDLSSTEEIGKQAFCMCLDIQSATLGSCEHAGAFWGCTNLTSLTLLDGITEISNSAFSNMTNLTNVKLPATLKKIGNQAFYGCENLNFSDGLPEGLEEIDNSAFYNCYKLNVTLPSTLTRIGEYAFYQSGMESVTIPTSVTEIGSYAFYSCESLNTINIPYAEGVLTLETTFQSSNNVENIIIDRNFTVNNASQVFAGSTEKTNVTIGSHVTAIPDYAFYSSSFKSLILGANVASIGRNAFLYATIPSLTLPIACTTIGKDAFSYSYIDNLYVPYLTPIALPTEHIEQLFNYSNTKLWVPGGTMALYQTADGWKRFENIDYWSYVVTSDVAGKGTLAIANGEAVTDNGTNTEKSIVGANLVEAGAGEAVSGLFVREKDLTLTPTPARGYEVAIKANGADVAAVEGAYKIASLTANQTIAATFTPIKYTLTYDLAGGTLAEGQENPATYTVESDAITLKNPTRKGYTFEGWTGTELEKATVEVTIAKNSIGNRSYKATWKPIVYTISYDAAGGTLAEGNPATYTIETADISLKAPTRRGYTFEGWTGTGLTEATKTVTIAKGSTENREYKATWKVITYTIDYDLAGGALPTGMSNPATYTVENDVITLKNPTRANYEFAGWTGTGLTAATMEVTIAKGSIDNRKYTATWKPVSYKLNYDLAEGSLPAGKANPATYNIETADFTLVNPVRAHYDFAGWTGTGLSAATMTVTVTKGSSGERSYTATWTPCIYNVAISKTGEGTVEATKLKPQYTDDVVLTITPAQNYELAKLTVDGTDVTADVKDGKYTISNVSADVTVVADFKLTVIPGDVNASGKVDIVDVTTTIDYILGKNPKGFIKAAADINNDGDVNIVDVTSIIDIILGKK